MDIDSLRVILADALLTIPFEIDGDGLASPDVARVFTAFLPGGKLTLSGARELGAGADRVVIAGRWIGELLGADAPAAEATFTVDGAGNAQARIVFSELPAGWTLADAFPALAASLLAALAYETPRLVVDSAAPGVSIAELAAANAEAADLLAPLVVVELPEVTLTVAAGDTLEALAARLELTPDDLAGRVAATPGLFAAGTELTLSLERLGVRDLLDRLRVSAACDNAAGMISRFLYHGLRLPRPDDAGFLGVGLAALAAGAASSRELTGLYRLTGQQFPAPPLGTADEPAALALTVSGGAPWLRFVGVHTTAEGDTLESLAGDLGTTASVLEEINPEVDFGRLAAGTEIRRPLDELAIALDQAALAREYPATSLDPKTIREPGPLALGRAAPVRYGLARRIAWQAAEAPPFGGGAPDALIGTPGLWLFPDVLLDNVARFAAVPYTLKLGRREAGRPLRAEPVDGYSFTCLVRIRVRRLPDVGGAGANTYLVLGADEDGRGRLLDLWRHLAGDDARIDLLQPADPTSARPSGLVSPALDRAATAVLKTNLSTLTHSGPVAGARLAAGPPAGDFFATANAARDFVRLLWEASVVGTGGFYLRWVGADGGGLPASVFAGGDDVELRLVATVASQSRAGGPDRRLYPFNNAVLVRRNVDPASALLFLEAADGSDTVTVATVPPGHVGFKTTRESPEHEAESPAQRLRGLYGLLGWQVLENAFFRQGNEGLPVGPAGVDSAATGGLTPHPDDAPADGVWDFDQVLPAFRLGKANPAPASAALPAPAENPYAGVGLAGGEPASVRLALAFQDVFGNRLADPGELSLPFGYTDPVLGVSSWPGAAAVYRFSGSFAAGDGPRLELGLRLDLAQYQPAEDDAASAVERAAAHALRYRDVHFQVSQDDVTFTLRTSVDRRSLAAGDRTYPLPREAVERFVRSAFVFLSAARAQKPAAGGVTLDPRGLFVPYASAAGETLSALAAKFGTTARELAEINRGLPVFAAGRTLTVDGVSVTTSERQSFDGLLAAFAAAGLDAGLERLAEAVAETADLFPAATFFAAPLPSAAAAAGGDASLGELAGVFRVAADDLAVVNRALAGFLRPGAAVTVAGVTLTVETGDTLDALAGRFAAANVATTAAGIARANPDAAGLVFAGARFLLPPPPLSLSVAVEPHYPETVFPLTVGLEIARDPARVSPELAASEGVRRQVTAVGPDVAEAHGALTLAELAERFESAFPPTLKLATGNKRSTAAAADPSLPLWAVCFGDGGVGAFRVRGGDAVTFALKPLANEPISRRGVPVRPYASGEGLAETARPTDFENVDLDVWMRQFLAAVDLFLSPAYAAAAYALEDDHAAFERVAGEKSALAGGLAGGLTAVLADPPPGADPASAREALRQRLLTRLSAAYEVEAVLQVPVTVSSPYTGAGTAPRLAGSPRAATFAVSGEQTIAGVAAAFSVSRRSVAAILADVGGILRPGAVVSMPGGEAYTVTAEDTLSRLAAALGTGLAELAEGLLVDPSSGGAGLFRPGAVLNLTSVARTVAAGDTFDLLGDFFNTSVAALAEANRSLPDLFREGAEIRFDGRSATVAAGQTLAGVAQALGTEPEVLANGAEVRANPGLLRPGAVLRTLQAVPELALSTFKTPLADGGAVMNVLLDLERPSEVRKLFLDLDATIVEMELPDVVEGGIGDYQASSWLTFVRPMRRDASPAAVTTAVGQVEVPIPLRVYPTPPSMVSQSGDAGRPGTGTLGETLLWDYAFTFEGRLAGQDDAYLRLVFNESGNGGEAAFVADAGTALFDPLARFAAVWPALQEDLARLPALAPGAADPVALAAVRAFAELTAGVAAGLTAVPAAAGALASARERRYLYLMEETFTATEHPELDTLKLAAAEAPVDGGPIWPRVQVSTPEGFVELEVVAETSDERVHRYPPDLAAAEPRARRFSFPGRNVLVEENGSGGVFVERNAGLVEGRATHPAFLYRTPLVRYANAVVPFNLFGRTFEIGSAADLAASLAAVFETLLAGDPEPSRVVRVVCRYGYELAAPEAAAPPEASIQSLLPVVFRPNEGFGPTWTAELAAAIESWQERNRPSRQRGFYVFEVGLFSMIDPSSTRPLLQLPRLIYRLTA